MDLFTPVDITYQDLIKIRKQKLVFQVFDKNWIGSKLTNDNNKDLLWTMISSIYILRAN